MLKSTLIALILALAVLNGCASLTVHPFEPKPNVDVESAKLGLVLDLGEAVQDTFEVARSGSIPSFKVEGWRQSLLKGFNNGFYAGQVPATKSGTRLQIIRADVAYAPAAVRADSMISALIAQITYQARLLGLNGQVVKKSSGTVASKQAITSAAGCTDGVRSAIESMYEKIAADFFAVN